MDINPAINHVVFEIDHKGTLKPSIGSGPTQAEDCVRQAWQQVVNETGASGHDVRRVYSEWEPSPGDLAFLEQLCPSAEITHSFERPRDGQWDAAFTEARRIILEAAEANSSGTEGDEEDGDFMLLVLRDADGLSETMVGKPVADDFQLCMALVGPTPHGTVGINYILTNFLQNQPVDVDDLWNEAYQNLMVGLRIQVAEEKGERLFILEREGGFAASAIGLPDFPDRARSWVPTGQILFGIPNPDTLLVCGVNSPFAQQLQKAVLESRYQGAINLTPSVLQIEGGKFSIVTQRV